MSSTPVNSGVRVSHRMEGTPLHAAGHAAPPLRIEPTLIPASIDINPPFPQQLANALDTVESRLAASYRRLREADMHIQRAGTILADLRETLASTMDVIHATQQRLAISDRVIARAQTLGCRDKDIHP